jgi:hypothetical protein
MVLVLVALVAQYDYILNTGTDCGFYPPLPSGEACPEQCRSDRGEGSQKSENRDRPQYNHGLSHKFEIAAAVLWKMDYE